MSGTEGATVNLAGTGNLHGEQEPKADSHRSSCSTSFQGISTEGVLKLFPKTNWSLSWQRLPSKWARYGAGARREGISLQALQAQRVQSRRQFWERPCPAARSLGRGKLALFNNGQRHSHLGLAGGVFRMPDRSARQPYKAAVDLGSSHRLAIHSSRFHAPGQGADLPTCKPCACLHRSPRIRRGRCRHAHPEIHRSKSGKNGCLRSACRLRAAVSRDHEGSGVAIWNGDGQRGTGRRTMAASQHLCTYTGGLEL